MRTIQIFILRLLVDPDTPRALRGSLEPVPEGEPRTFTNRRRLLALLDELSSPSACDEQIIWDEGMQEE